MQIREIVAFRGAGDLASGVALRLWRAGYRVVLSELAHPLCIRRSVAFANAVYEGSMQVEDTISRLVKNAQAVSRCWQDGVIPLLVDPELAEIRKLNPDVLVDARIIKNYRTDTALTDAPLVIGLGPGFVAGENAHAVIETSRGHDLGRVYWKGAAEPDTGLPGLIGGEGIKRVQKAPAVGVFEPIVKIGDSVTEGALLARIGKEEMHSPIAGIVRGVIYPGTPVSKGLKVMDIDPRGKREHCFSASDKANALGGAVLEAILTWSARGSVPPQC